MHERARTGRRHVPEYLVALCAATCLLAPALGSVPVRATETVPGADLVPLETDHLEVQGLRRTVRWYRPARLAERPALVIALHGGGGDGGRFRRLTAGAFERLADEHGFVVAYPDGLGGHWNDCRARAPYRAALAGIDDVAFLRAVVGRAAGMLRGDPDGVFVVGYSNGGHLVLRIALEVPGEFDALAVIGAHLPVAGERDCAAAADPVPLLLVSGTDDPVNPWSGGDVQAPGGPVLGRVLSAEATVAHFVRLASRTGASTPAVPRDIPRAVRSEAPTVVRCDDRDTTDGVRVELHRWPASGNGEVVLLVMRGGGHTLPGPRARFPADLVGATSRDVDGAGIIWEFFARHRPR